MANKKRDINGYQKSLDRYRLNRSDLLAIEKMLWEYADAREMKHAGISKLPKERKHMPRKAVDRYVSIGRYKPFRITVGWNEYAIHYAGVDWIYCEDSVKFLSKKGYPKRTRYLELAAWPGIKITFTPLSTSVYAQTHYATGAELKVMRETIHAVEEYLSKATKKTFNVCLLE